MALFEQSYICFSFSCIKKSHLEDGNRIIMPQSAFISLEDLQVEYPVMFEITACNSESAVSDRRVSHCGVLEFTADDGFVFMPNWLMRNLKVGEGDSVILKNVTLPKGSFMKIQPHETKFISLPQNPKEILEGAFKNFACVTAGDTIMINHENHPYYIDVLETKPSSKGISLVETDCEVDFARPLDYKEPVKAPPRPPVVRKTKAQEKPKFKAFSGVARRLDGQPVVVSQPSPVVEEEEAAQWADHSRKQSFLPRKRPAGTLMFGRGDQPSDDARKETTTKQDTTEDKKVQETGDENVKKFQPFTGKKYSLADSVVVNGLGSEYSSTKRFRHA